MCHHPMMHGQNTTIDDDPINPSSGWSTSPSTSFTQWYSPGGFVTLSMIMMKMTSFWTLASCRYRQENMFQRGRSHHHLFFSFSHCHSAPTYSWGWEYIPNIVLVLDKERRNGPTKSRRYGAKRVLVPYHCLVDGGYHAGPTAKKRKRPSTSRVIDRSKSFSNILIFVLERMDLFSWSLPEPLASAPPATHHKSISSSDECPMNLLSPFPPKWIREHIIMKARQVRGNLERFITGSRVQYQYRYIPTQNQTVFDIERKAFGFVSASIIFLVESLAQRGPSFSQFSAKIYVRWTFCRHKYDVPGIYFNMVFVIIVTRFCLFMCRVRQIFNCSYHKIIQLLWMAPKWDHNIIHRLHFHIFVFFDESNANHIDNRYKYRVPGTGTVKKWGMCRIRCLINSQRYSIFDESHKLKNEEDSKNQTKPTELCFLTTQTKIQINQRFFDLLRWFAVLYYVPGTIPDTLHSPPTVCHEKIQKGRIDKSSFRKMFAIILDDRVWSFVLKFYFFIKSSQKKQNKTMTVQTTILLAAAVVVQNVAGAGFPHVSLGPRPFWLVEEMRDNSIKQKLGTWNKTFCFCFLIWLR